MSARTDDELVTLICRNSDAFQIYLMGYAQGHREGQKHMALTNDEIIELAARRTRVLELLDGDIRKTMQSNREWFDVLAARERDAK